MTYRELAYMCLDKLKLSSDDSYFNEAHVMFLLSEYRAFLLKQRYSDIKKQIPNSNYQTICIDLELYSGDICGKGEYLRSTKPIPFLMTIGIPSIHPNNYFEGNITYINRDRMKYIGYNKYTTNIIYSTIASDNHLYLKSINPQFIHLEKVQLTGIFQDCNIPNELQCDLGESNCNPLDKVFPIEDSLVPPLLDLVVKELLPTYSPEDSNNNAKDDLQNKGS